MSQIKFTLNGAAVSAYVEPNWRWLDLLRDTLNLTGTKEACGQGECGAWTVLLDNEAVNSCLVLAEQVDGKSVTTIEGLAKDGVLDPLQQAFVDCGAIQCGFCTPGMIMSAKGLLLKNPNPTEEEIKEAVEGNICRCTGYAKIGEAIQAAAAEMNWEEGK